jgi:hypothetical protein
MRANEFITEGVAGPKKCWPGHRKVGTQPGTGKNKGKRVNDCEKIKKKGVAESAPNFEREWDEAIRYPEFANLGKEAWIKLANNGKLITVTRKTVNKINNTDAADPKSFKLLDPEKQKRALAQLATGDVEMPIVARYSDGYLELIGGNTRLTAQMAKDGQAEVWVFNVPEELQQGMAERMLPKSAFAGSDKNKLGSAAHAKGKQKGPVKRGQFVGGMEEGAPIVVAQAPIHIRNPKKAPQPYRNKGDIVPDTKPPSTEKRGVKGRPGQRPMPDYSVEEAKKKGADGKACWDGYRYNGTENGKDKCVKIGEHWENKMTPLVNQILGKYIR